jgi:hypothetical protein
LCLEFKLLPLGFSVTCNKKLPNNAHIDVQLVLILPVASDNEHKRQNQSISRTGRRHCLYRQTEALQRGAAIDPLETSLTLVEITLYFLLLR